MIRLLLSTLFFFFLWATHAQNQKLNEKVDLTIEAFHKEITYVSDGLDLWKVNFRKPTKRDSSRFQKLINCSFPLSYYEKPIDSLPAQVNAFGRVFNRLKKQPYIVHYVTDELDSQVHYLSFYYDEYSEKKELQKVEVSSLNTRSNKVTPKYLYRFVLGR